MTADRSKEAGAERPAMCPSPAATNGPDTMDSRQLFRGRREIQIRHGDNVYRLRITSNGKLILNK